VSEKSDIDKQTLAIGERETWSDGSRFSVIENRNNLTIIPRYRLDYSGQQQRWTVRSPKCVAEFCMF